MAAGHPVRRGRRRSRWSTRACGGSRSSTRPSTPWSGSRTDRSRRPSGPTRTSGRGIVHGPLHGVPFTIKDSLDTAGVITTAGTVGWADRVPDRDATVVARLKAAGGILLGKTNTPEFTWANDADNLVYGRTSNPYDLDRSPGGSSGGSAAIVAAGGSPFDIGSDTGRQHPPAVARLRRRGPQADERSRAADRSPSLVPRDPRVADPTRADRASRRRPRPHPADHRRTGWRGPARRPGRARRSGGRVDRRPARRLVRRQRRPHADARRR